MIRLYGDTPSKAAPSPAVTIRLYSDTPAKPATPTASTTPASTPAAKSTFDRYTIKQTSGPRALDPQSFASLYTDYTRDDLKRAPKPGEVAAAYRDYQSG